MTTRKLSGNRIIPPAKMTTIHDKKEEGRGKILGRWAEVKSKCAKKICILSKNIDIPGAVFQRFDFSIVTLQLFPMVLLFSSRLLNNSHWSKQFVISRALWITQCHQSRGNLFR